MLDVSCPYCHNAVHPGHIDSHVETCEFKKISEHKSKMIDAIHLKTQVLGMELVTNKGKGVSVVEIKRMIENQHKWLLANPNEYMMYTTTGKILILSHRMANERMIGTYLTELVADGYVADPTGPSTSKKSRAESIEIE